MAQRTRALRDGDGLELLRAQASSTNTYYGARSENSGWLHEALEVLFAADTVQKLRYPRLSQGILQWLVYLNPPDGAVDFMLEAIETTFSLVPRAELARIPGKRSYGDDWRNNHRLFGWLQLARQHRSHCPTAWQDAHHVRLWRLLRWMDEPGPPVPRHRPPLEDVLAASKAGGATEADLLDHVLGPRQDTTKWHGLGAGFGSLHQLTGWKPSALAELHPILNELLPRCRERILQVELARGEMPTAASAPALALRHAGGTDVLVRLLSRLGREKLVRGWTYDSLSKASVYSHLLRATAPLPSDTSEAFVAQVGQVPQKRLLKVAVYAPQWASFMERALEWPGLADAVWWVHAHTKDSRWRVSKEIREMWTVQISEHTPLSAHDLTDGAVDVAWFYRAHEALGPERWAQLYKVARFASGGGGHKRAQLFSDAMLGRVAMSDLVARINDKRHKDTVRALGLLPLPEARERDLLERYRALQEFQRSSRRFGAQRQASEKLAVQIGMQNLARTAGYPDPLRLEWDMEAQETADLVDGARVEAGKVAVTLRINAWGEPELTVKKKAKTLRAIPAALRKNPDIVTLKERRRRLKRQASRMRRSLEQAMDRGDRFSRAELCKLLTHPLLSPMLEHLVFIGADAIGYPDEGGAALRSHDGALIPLDAGARLRIAHPYDLFVTQEWHHWQRDCYLGERIQPFKQVFRELYLLTEAEKAQETISRRYAGHQVNPRQALALLGRRAWVNYPEQGVRRTFHEEGISAWLDFLGGYSTPAEVEGLTLEGVWFSKRGEWQPLPLVQIPPRLFSQVMRDLDLVVSVAHQGGVDPEASASTVEMRTVLIRETCDMLELANVRLQGQHALIAGELSDYSIHLGSAVVHRQPGGALCIVPVHSQHRGRLFLPFADDDPRTAEVLSKVLLLARDKEIKDPTILEQILSR